MRSRLVLLQLFFLLSLAAITARLFILQVLEHNFYKNLAENQHQLYQTLVPRRGEISVQERRNRKETAVVTNIEKDLVYAVPPDILQKEETAVALAPVLDLPKVEILEKISYASRKWVPLKKQLLESAAKAVGDLKLSGIYLQPEIYRFHPEQSFASQVLGFFAYRDNTRVGQYGIEEYFEEVLAGKSGSLTLDKDAFGRWITSGVRKIQAAEDGANIVLTLDRSIQFKAEEILKQTVTKYEASGGSLLVSEPKTGRILALANFPTFDANEFNLVEDPKVFRNQAISEAYEPGSVFKPITMASALEAEVISPDTTYEDPGLVVIDDYTIRNANNKVYGKQTMIQVLEQSINTGAIFVVNQVGDEQFLEMVKKFGFGEAIGITLPAEASGNISNLKGGGAVHYATAAFGQGITVTPLQLAMAYAVIANGGKLMKPQIVEEIRYPDGRKEKFASDELRQVITPKTAHTLAAMLVSVVENGHGKRAKVEGYYLAGKTGTAEVPKKDGPGYDPQVTIGTFAGFGPVDDPAFVIVVKIVNPKAARFAETTAAPAFGEMARFLVNYFQIPPTRQ